MSKTSLDEVLCLPDADDICAHNYSYKRKEKMKTMLTAESAARVGKMMGHSAKEMHQMRAFDLEGRNLFETFRGSGNDMSGAGFAPGGSMGGLKDFVKTRPSSPFDSADDSFDATDRTSLKLKRTPTRLLSDEQKKIARALNIDEAELAERLDTLTDDEENVLGVDGLPRKTRVKAPHSVRVQDLVA